MECGRREILPQGRGRLGQRSWEALRFNIRCSLWVRGRWLRTLISSCHTSCGLSGGPGGPSGFGAVGGSRVGPGRGMPHAQGEMCGRGVWGGATRMRSPGRCHRDGQTDGGPDGGIPHLREHTGATLPLPSLQWITHTHTPHPQYSEGSSYSHHTIYAPGLGFLKMCAWFIPPLSIPPLAIYSTSSLKRSYDC